MRDEERQGIQRRMADLTGNFIAYGMALGLLVWLAGKQLGWW